MSNAGMCDRVTLQEVNKLFVQHENVVSAVNKFSNETANLSLLAYTERTSPEYM